MDPLDIDPRALDREWLKQSRMSREAGRLEADARYELARAEARRKLVFARLRRDIRANPTVYEFGAKKPSIDEVDDAATVHEAYQQALAAEAEAQRALDVARANTVAASHDRRKALESLVELLSLDYYAEREPAAPRRIRKDVEDRRHERERDGGVDETEFPTQP